MTAPLRRSLLPAALATLMAAPVLLVGARPAQADVAVRIGGHVKVRAGGGHVRVRTHRYHRHRTRGSHVRLRVGGHIYVGGGVYHHRRRFAQPPPPRDRCCERPPRRRPVRAYYAPVSSPPPTSVVTTRAEPEPPRFGIGAFAGQVSAEDGASGDDVGLLGRLRLTRALHLEAELAKTEVRDGMRVDRRIGGALLYDLAAGSSWSPHILGGLGVTQVDMDEGEWSAQQRYAELGIGLGYAFSDRFQIVADIRTGARTRTDEAAPDGTAMKQIAPPADQREGYTRGRLGAILSF